MTKEEAITCKDCKHRPVDDHGSIEPPYDVENRRLDEMCPCINKADWMYSYVPEDEFFCAYVEKKSVTPVHKKSKWIFTKTVLDKYGCTVECPSCHKKWTTYDEIRFEKETKYCPNCGEKMEDEIMTREEVNIIEIPKNATNGDMIKAMFPDSEIKEIRGTFKGDLLGYRTWLGGRSQDFLLDWWNEPFKRGKEE